MSCAGHKESQSAGAVEVQLRDDLMQVLLATAPGVPEAPPLLPKPKPKHKPFTLDHNHPPPSGLGVHTLSIEGDDDDDDDEESAPPPPDFSTRFLSLTLTDTEPISVLLEHRLLLARLGRSLLGSRGDEDVLVPITLDLRDLPLEASGVVCGVAGRLAEGTRGGGGGGGSPAGGGEDGGEGIEISFLSTARAGTVIVRESELERAVKALEEGAEVEREREGEGEGEGERDVEGG